MTVVQGLCASLQKNTKVNVPKLDGPESGAQATTTELCVAMPAYIACNACHCRILRPASVTGWNQAPTELLANRLLTHSNGQAASHIACS